MRNIFKKEKVVKVFQRMIMVVIPLLCGGIVASWIIPFAYERRGYYAFGGEWGIVIAIILLGWFGLSKCFAKKTLEEETVDNIIYLAEIREYREKMKAK
ncbi:MAG: hypothetical protein ACRCW1_11640 [Anaerotignaceae bacterium]